MLKAVIFDFNGIIVDDERIHLELFQGILSELDIPLGEEEYFDKYFGYSDRDLLLVLLEEHERKIKKSQIERLIGEKNRRYLEKIAEQSILFPGAREMVESFAAAYPLGIVSGALRSEIETILERENLAEHFGFIVAADDVTAGKPDPEGYVLALNHINNRLDLQLLPVNPSECLVIEDSPAGIDSARALGMRCVGVATSVTREKLVEADLVYDALTEIRMEWLKDLFTEPLERVGDAGGGPED